MSSNTNNYEERIEKMINGSDFFIFTKGTPEFPMCPFVATAIQILKSHKIDFQYFDILKEEGMKQMVKDYTNCQTFPQIFINGKFVGGCDKLKELEASGELDKLIK